MSNVANLTIIKGQDYALKTAISSSTVPYDLTGYSVKAQVRTDYNGQIVAQFAVSGTLDTSGSFYLVLTDAQTASAPDKQCVWSVVLTKDGNSREFIRGNVDFIPTATK